MGPIIAAVVGALLYRLRGGWFSQLTGWKQKTQIMRLIWATPTAALMTEMTDAPLWLWPVLVVSIFTAQALFGTGQYLRDVPLQLPDLLGFYRNALAALPIFYFSPLLFAAYAAFGGIHAGLYWLGFRMRGNGDYGDVMLGAGSWALIVALRV